MVFKKLKLSTLSGLAFVALGFLLVPVAVVQANNPATIDSASWRVSKDKLKVKGKLAPKGTVITVTDADSGEFLGTAVANKRNIWRLAVVLLSEVPCSVKAETSGSADILAVEDVPADCGADAGTPTVPADPVDPPADPADPPADPVDPPADPTDPLVEMGKNLFFSETFNGNGRTCGTCHPAENNFTIDPAFISNLPPDDPLFVSEYNTDLTGLEDPVLLRQFGLIRANADGFENPTEKFVVRSVSHILGLALSIQSNATEAPLQMTGWSGDGAPGSGTLRDFSTGAVVQHFTRSLDRVEGQDFRLPTESELDAMEAYMLSLSEPASMDLQTLRLTDTSAERGRVLFITEDSENGTKRAAKCNACHTNAGALTIAGINENFDTGVEDAVHAADMLGVLRPRDGGFGTQFDEDMNAFGNGTFNPAPLLHAADTAPYFHNNVAATLEDAISHYESNEFRMSPEGQRLLFADSGGRELSIDVDALAAFLRVINVVENIRSSIDYMTRVKEYVTVAGIQELLTASNVDLNDVLRVLAEGSLHEEVVPLITSAKGLIASAMAEPESNIAERNNFIDLAIAEAEAGRDLMVDVLPVADTVAPVVAITAPVAGSTVFGLVTILADVTDDAGISNVVFKAGQVEIGQDSSAPFEAMLDTAVLPDGEISVTVMAIDPGGNSGSAAMTLVIDNASVTPPPDTAGPTVAITAPSDGSTVSGSVMISVDAADDVGVAKVIFRIGTTEIGQDSTPPYEQVWDTTMFSNGARNINVMALDLSDNTMSSSISVVVDNASVCTVYSCPNPPPPPSDPPPDPVTPDGTSPDGEFEGIVTNVDLQASTVSVDSGGVNVTLKITSETGFAGSIATNIAQILIGHVAQGEFFRSTSETVWIEADLPPGF